MKILRAVILAIIFSSFVFAQGKPGTLLGTVINAESREPIASAKVTILGTNYSATTTKDGQYKIKNVPDGIYQIKAEAAKYESQTRNNVRIGGDGKVTMFFFLPSKSDVKEEEVEVQPNPISTVWPKYPQEAMEQGLEGVVYVKLLINEKGVVEKAFVERSDAEIFDQPSIDAAMKWQFKPALQKGVAVSTWVMLPFKFKLDEGHKKKEETKKN